MILIPKTVIICGIWDAVLDQIRRTRLKKLNSHDFGSKKVNLYGIRDAILDQIRRTRLKKCISIIFIQNVKN